MVRACEPAVGGTRLQLGPSSPEGVIAGYRRHPLLPDPTVHAAAHSIATRVLGFCFTNVSVHTDTVLPFERLSFIVFFVRERGGNFFVDSRHFPRILHHAGFSSSDSG